ncbi:MAG TPA: methyltransferase domain-containing protein [Thermodesulfobacteriota bacterium]|nr:methyltransferase domain-containing protein [Thermodesulfobacteriota bacterium]
MTIGAHNNKHIYDKNLLPWLVEHEDIKSFLEIGCGTGWQTKLALSLGLDSIAIDGDNAGSFHLPHQNFLQVDYRKGTSKLNRRFDLGWSVEFAEHVPEDYIDNYMRDFALCDRVVFTAAPKGWASPEKRHQHPNEQDEPYWIKLFTKYGFRHDEKMTETIRRISCLVDNHKNIRRDIKQFIKNRGLYFENSC